jgi:hypothetical protein
MPRPAGCSTRACVGTGTDGPSSETTPGGFLRDEPDEDARVVVQACSVIHAKLRAQTLLAANIKPRHVRRCGPRGAAPRDADLRSFNGRRSPLASVARALTGNESQVLAPGPSSPLVSVITPVYNGAEYLAECVESVLRQSYQNWEYIVLDNASTDDSHAIAVRYAEKDERIRVYRSSTLVSAAANTANSCTQTTGCSRTAWPTWLGWPRRIHPSES